MYNKEPAQVSRSEAFEYVSRLSYMMSQEVDFSERLEERVKSLKLKCEELTKNNEELNKLIEGLLTEKKNYCEEIFQLSGKLKDYEQQLERLLSLDKAENSDESEGINYDVSYNE